MTLTLQQLWFLIRIGIALLVLELICPGAEVRVSWEANPEPDISAYVVVAKADGVEDVVSVTRETGYISISEPGWPPPTEAALDLAPGVAWSITLTAFNTNGDQSDSSDPVSWMDPLPEEPSEPEPAPTPTVTRHTYTMQVGNDLDGWVDMSRVVVDNPPPNLFFRVRREVETIEKDP